MQNQKANRPAFQAVNLDPIDTRLDAKAVEKGIPKLVARPQSRRGGAGEGRAGSRTRTAKLSVELPEYVWTGIRMRAAQEMVTVRHVVMLALRAHGIEIRDADMIDDGRRARGGEPSL